MLEYVRFNEKGQQVINVKELADLYINENYSLELLAKIYKIKISIMSRILWKFNLPVLKEEKYKNSGGVTCEKRRIEDIKRYLEKKGKNWKQEELSVSAEDLFFMD